MHHAQLLIYEKDGKLAAQLRPLARERRWLLREVRQPEGCARLLARSGVGVVVVKLGRDLEAELRLVQMIDRRFPSTAVVVVGDSEEGAPTSWGQRAPQLAGLAWDLGARFVLFPPLSPDLLPEILIGLMSPPETPPNPEAEPADE
jgi:hypothetical protein